jgi:hypothetical protein
MGNSMSGYQGASDGFPALIPNALVLSTFIRRKPSHGATSILGRQADILNGEKYANLKTAKFTSVEV